MKKKAATIHEDVLVEILYLVSKDVVDLFRCAVTCKRWCAIIADPSFLRRRWPENACHPFSLLGFFVQQRRSQADNAELFIGMDDVDMDSPQPPFFVPAQQRQPLGSPRRFLSSFVTGVPAGLLDGAEPLTARCGLLLVHLAHGSSTDLIHLAVCNPLAGTCDVLPPLESPASSISCAILTGSDYCSTDGLQQRKSTPDYSTFFTVLTVVSYTRQNSHQEYALYTFSSAKPSWSAPRSCFDKTWLYGKAGFMMPLWNHSGVVCRGTTHWLAAYMSYDGTSSIYHTFNVSIETGHLSLTELSISADQLGKRDYGWPRLSVARDGELMLFHVHEETRLPRLDIWTRQGHDSIDSETFWLRVGSFYLKVRKEKWVMIRVWFGEKSSTIFILEEPKRRVNKFDIETGEMEDVTRLFRDGLCISAVPMEIDWLALFLSRLGGHLS